MFDSYQSKECGSFNSSVNDMKWNCDGSYLAVAVQDKSVKIHSYESGNLKLIQSVSCLNSPIQVCWHPTVISRFAVISSDRTLDIWDVKGQQAVIKITTPGNNLYLSWSPDGKYIAVGNKVDNIMIFEVGSGKLLKKYKSPYEINEIQWNQLSNHLLMASGSPDSGCTVDVLQWKVTSFSQDKDTSVDMAMDSNTIAPLATTTATATTNDSTISEYDLILVDRLVAHSSNCYCLKLNNSFTHMAVGSQDFLISLWDLQDLCCLTTISVFSSPVKQLDYHCSGKYIGATCDHGNNMTICDALNGDILRTLEFKQPLSSFAWHTKLNAVVVTYEEPADRSKNRPAFTFMKFLTFKED